MKLWAVAVVAVASPFCAANGALAQASEDLNCVYSINSVPRGAPTYAQFPVRTVSIRNPAPVVIHGRDARTFRTRLREGAKGGPNFAGYFTIVSFGCGTDCAAWAVVDALTGKVFFDPTVSATSSVHVDPDEPTQTAPGIFGGFSVRWRRDSSLLVVLGAPGEDAARDGVGYYNWTGTQFVLVRQYAAKDICHPRSGD